MSVYVSRDPISRLLAGDGWTLDRFPDVIRGTGKESTWWEYAKGKRNVDNYALAVLAGDGCCNGNETDPAHLDTAKKVLDRFTFILDIECLGESLQALAGILDIGLPPPSASERFHTAHMAAKDRIPYPEVYDYLVEKNRLSIELHEYAKSRSLVDCSKIDEMQSQGQADENGP